MYIEDWTDPALIGQHFSYDGSNNSWEVLSVTLDSKITCNCYQRAGYVTFLHANMGDEFNRKYYIVTPRQTGPNYNYNTDAIPLAPMVDKGPHWKVINKIKFISDKRRRLGYEF